MEWPPFRSTRSHGGSLPDTFIRRSFTWLGWPSAGLYSDGLILSCNYPKIWTSPLLQPVGVSKNRWMSGKLCRPWSDDARSVASDLVLYCLQGTVFRKLRKYRTVVVKGESLMYTRILRLSDMVKSDSFEHIFITTFMKHIQFCIIPETRKGNSSQIYQTCELTLFIYPLFPISVVFSSFWCKTYFPKRKVTKCNSQRFEYGVNLGVFKVGYTGLNCLPLIISQTHKLSFLLWFIRRVTGKCNENLNIVISEICSSTPESVRESPRLTAISP